MSKARHNLIDFAYRMKGSWRFQGQKPKHFAQSDSRKSPVILLAGMSLRWQFLRHLGIRISLEGHAVYVVPGLGRNFLSVAASAQLIRKLIEKNDLRDVVIVAHSKGGIVGKYLLIHHNKDKRIKRLIAIAPPFYGSTWARLHKHPVLQELLPGSQFLQELNEHTEVNKRIEVILSEHDNVIVPHTTYLVGGHTVVVKGHGHHHVIFLEEVEDIIMKILDK